MAEWPESEKKKPTDLAAERRKRGLPKARVTAPTGEPSHEGGTDISSQRPMQQAQREMSALFSSLINGKFSELRDGIGRRGEAGEVRFVLHAVESLRYPHVSAALPEDANNFVRILFTSEHGSAEYYSALFAILRESGFTAKDKAEIRESFSTLATKTSPNPDESARWDKHYINAMVALESAFPK